MSQLCHEIHQLFNQLERFEFPFDASRIPQNGIYILFEKGESGHGVDRIVRVGIHTGDSRLSSRIDEHFLNENKDRSIFRKNIGRAILNKRFDPYLEMWDHDLTTSKAKESYKNTVDHHRQSDIENEVTSIIQSNFSFVVIPVDDNEKRKELEAKLISTISHCNQCLPSERWLGNASTKEKIRRSGLWQEHHLYKQGLSQTDLEELKSLAGRQEILRDVGTFFYHQDLRELFKSGILPRQWAAQYPQLFDEHDLSQALNQPKNHFYEWLAAILIFHTTGYLSLIEKYSFEKRHKRKYNIFQQLVSEETRQFIDNKEIYGRRQPPDLLVYAPDFSTWDFYEAKGPSDSIKPKQKEYFKALAEVSKKVIRVIWFKELNFEI